MCHTLQVGARPGRHSRRACPGLPPPGVTCGHQAPHLAGLTCGQATLVSQLQTQLWVRESSTITVGLSQLCVSDGWFGVCAHTLTQTTADVALHWKFGKSWS